MAVQKKTKKKIIIASIVIAILLLIIFLVAPFTMGAIMYDSVFNVRYETPEYLMFYLDDFAGLNADRHEFTSNHGTKLVGYHYYMLFLHQKATGQRFLSNTAPQRYHL